MTFELRSERQAEIHPGQERMGSKEKGLLGKGDRQGMEGTWWKKANLSEEQVGAQYKYAL